MPVLPGAEPFAADGGPTGVLLVHGFTGSPQSLRPWAEHLAAAGLTVRLPRLPGHGTDWREMNRTGWTDWYAATEQAFLDLHKACGEVFVCGLSMGGTLAIRLAEQRPAEVAGLVLVNPSLTTLDRRARLLPLLSRVIRSFPPVGNDIKRPGVSELAYDRLPLRAAASLQQLWTRTSADLAAVSAPLLVYRSAQDHVVEPVNAQLLLAGVSSTDTQEHVLADSYHVATLDNDAQQIFDGSLDFIRAHSRLEAG
ncbi:MAG: alpha/beta hydrolase [Mycobacteriales bacterium]